MKATKILTIPALLSALTASAQYNPTVEVEGTYKPEVILQDRVNTFPERLRLGNTDSRLDYDMDGVVTDFAPLGVPMPATGWNDTRARWPYRGYAELQLSTRLDAIVNAGYRFVDNDKTLSGVYLRHNSTSLWKPKLSDAVKDTRRKIYDEMVGLYLRHDVPKYGMLDVDARYNLTYFNYYGFNPLPMSDMPDAPTQTLNQARFHAKWTSNAECRFRYYAGVDVNYTAFRSFYTSLTADECPGNRETLISPELGAGYRFGGSSVAGLDFSADFLLYSDKTRLAPAMPKNYSRFSFTPYYKWEGDNITFYGGPRIDVFADNGTALRLAPDVRFGWHTRGVGLELSATGGTELNSLHGNVMESKFCAPAIVDMTPAYTPVEARLKFGFGPFAGFRAEMEGAYKRTIHKSFGCWYTPYLSLYGRSAASSQPVAEDYLGTYMNLSGFQIGITLAYNYGEYFGIEAKMNYMPQDDDKAWFSGWDMPEVTAHIGVRGNPWSTLKLGVDWDLRACRKVPLLIAGADGSTLTRQRIGNLSMLGFSATYDILKNLRAEVYVDNLLNRLHQEWLPGVPVPGIAARLGLTFQF